MKRRGNAEGYIGKRKDGRWEARMRLPDNQRKGFYGDTRLEVVKQLQAFQAQVEHGTAVVADKLTATRYLHDWLDGCKPPALEVSTWLGYEQHVRLHLIPAFGSTKLVQLKPQQLQKLYADKLAAGKSTTTVRHIHACLHRALEEALRFDLVQRNVASLVKAPPMGKRPMQVYTPEQARKLLETAKGTRLEALNVLALNTGMREGELLGLKWREVDLDTGLIHVQQTLKVAGSGKRVLGKPKNVSSRRKVMLTPTAVAALRAHQLRQVAERLHSPAWHDTDLA